MLCSVLLTGKSLMVRRATALANRLDQATLDKAFRGELLGRAGWARDVFLSWETHAMNQDLSSALVSIFDEFRSGKERLSPEILAKRISEHHLSFSASGVAEVGDFVRRFFGDRGVFPVPSFLLPVISALLQDRHPKTVCDPWAGIGTILAAALDATRAAKAIAIVKNEGELELGRVLVSSVDWRLGDPLNLLPSLPPDLDVVVSIPPFGARIG